MAQSLRRAGGRCLPAVVNVMLAARTLLSHRGGVARRGKARVIPSKP
jgi:hypothetical protein